VMEPALKPCPYCGQQPVVSENPWGSRDVECDNGSCQVTTHVGTFEGDPFAAWNTRPGEEQAAKDERARIVAELRVRARQLEKLAFAMWEKKDLPAYMATMYEWKAADNVADDIEKGVSLIEHPSTIDIEQGR
jgi:hypothetical protein